MGTKRDDVKDDQDGRENYDGLSPEEIASLEEGDDDADVIDELLGEGEGEGDDPADDGGDGDLAGEDEGEEAGADAGDQSAEEQEGGDEGDEGEEEGDEARHPPIAAQPQDALQSFNARAAELEEKFNNGDIELPEYMREVMKIAEDRALYRMQMQMAVESDNRSWEEANEAFFQSNPDYSAARNPKRFKVLQAMVDSVYKDPDFAPTSYLGLLNEAKRRFDEAAGIDTAEKPTEKPAKPRLVSDRASLPPTIKDAPAEAAPPNGGGEFSVLDGLSGMELEAAVSRMSPEQQARWAEAG